MQNSAILLEELQALMKRKQSKEFYAKRLGISTADVGNLIYMLRNGIEKQNKVVEAIKENNSKRVNIEKGEIEVSGYWDNEPTPEQIIESHKIDTSKWKLSQFWSKQKSQGWQVSALFSQVKQTKEEQRADFEEFLKTYKPVSRYIPTPTIKLNANNACFIFNKQDSHLNKYDELGDNDIDSRFKKIYQKTQKILAKASAVNNIDKTVYILGSDEMNSEFTECTTKGTPQKNILSYHEAFEKVCQHEVDIINLLLANTQELAVIYVPGNHGEFVDWHIVSWLKAYFKNQSNLLIDSSELYTKYVKYSNTAICFNHGYGMKPEKLAAQFPIEFKEHWSSCDHFILMTGDKHVNIAKDLEGVEWYQLPALSSSNSKWDLLHGYKAKPRMTCFLIEESNGLTDVYKEQL